LEKEDLMKHEEVTHKIIGCAYAVYKKLGFGFLESVYRKAMVIELGRAGLYVEEEKPITVYYDDYVVGKFAADLYVEDLIIVELKSVQNIVSDHEVQLVNYLKGTKKDIGLLINFGQSGVDVKRKYKDLAKEN
jgi:GxxExxY protein